jgi:UDP-N-acetylmuramoyl-tripeptide--D-alanyl-D-alanine ligase
MSLLWTAQEMTEAMDGRPVGSLPEGVTGISIDSRTVGEGDAFFAIKGDKFDGHDFASAAIANGAALLVVAETKLPALGRLTAPMIVVNDVLAALEDLGRAARARSEAQIIAITGSAGKTIEQGDAAPRARTLGRSACLGGLLQQSLGRAADAGADAGDTPNTAFSKIGMNHPDEIRPLVKMVRPHVAIITTIAAAHLGNFKNLNEIAAAKAEIMEGVVKRRPRTAQS